MSARKPSCLLCKNNHLKTIYENNWELLGLGNVPVSFRICKSCGHFGQAPLPEPAVMQKHYETFSNYTILQSDYTPDPTPPRVTSRLLSLAKSVRPDGGYIYDVGCANGLNLYYFKQNGWDVGGCDPSQTAVEHSRKYHGIEVDLGWEDKCLANITNADIILFSHVVEHLYDPVTTLRRAAKSLAPDGHILFEVPCAIDPYSLPAGWLNFEHLSFFTAETILNLLALCELQLMEMRITPITEQNPLYPVITILARRDDDNKKQILNYYPGTLCFSEHFLKHEKNIWSKINEVISGISGSLFIWGAGGHTSQVFAHTPVREKLDIKGIIDSDPQKWGKIQGGFEVISPDIYFSKYRNNKILISSYASEKTIYRALKDKGINQENIIRLYYNVFSGI